MELTFPFKNMAINELIGFVDPYKFRDYIAVHKDHDPNTGQYFNTSIEIYEDGLPNFENELIQVVATTDQGTIDEYFRVLSREIGYVKEHVSKENISGVITEFNLKSAAKFVREVEAKTEEYWKSDTRKLKHLEEYEGFDYLSLLHHKAIPAKYINHNFYCIEEKLDFIDPIYTDELVEFVNKLSAKFLEIAYRYGRKWQAGELKSKHISFIKPILFVEGELDIEYLFKAAQLLDRQDIFNKIDIRHRGGYHNLDKLWSIYKTDNWETVPQKKIFLYDCDTEKTDENNGFNYKRIIPSVSDNPIKKGIENLFSKDLFQRAIAHKAALMDSTTLTGTKRGEPFTQQEYSIDKMEKRNLCDWICSNGIPEDFHHFLSIFNIIEEVLEN